MKLYQLGQRFDSDGNPLAGGKAYFRVAGTTTAATVYADSELTDALDYPIVADSYGYFPEVVYFDPDVSYRLEIIATDGSLADPISSADPVVEADVAGSLTSADYGAGSVDGDALGTGAVVDNLGFTPVNKAGDTMSGALRLAAPSSSINTNDAGYMIAPANTQDAAYALVLADAGKLILHTSGSAHAWTIPLNSSVAFPTGTTIAFANTGAGAVTLTRSGGVSLRIGGSSTDANVAVAQWGLGSLLKVGTDSWIATGVNLS